MSYTPQNKKVIYNYLQSTPKVIQYNHTINHK